MSQDAVTNNGGRGFLSIGRSLAVNAKRFPHKVAVHDARRSMTYKDLNEHVNQLAYALAELGLKKGEHVAILFGNTIEHLLTIYAAAKLGAVSVVLDAKWKPNEIVRALRFFDCSLLACENLAGGAVTPDAVDGLKYGALSWEGGDASAGMAGLMKGQPVTEYPSTVGDEDLFMIMLTAGTTGTPKGCRVNHKTYALQSMNASIGRGCNEFSRELAVVPIYYNSGRSTVLAHLFFGGTVYLRNRFDPRETLELIEREKISSLALASTMCHRLLQLPELGSTDTRSITALRKAGLPFTRKMVEELMERFTPAIFQGYASTDAGQSTFLRPHEQLEKIGSSGRPIWGVEVDVVNERHDPLPAGQEGEIRVRGPLVCQGYYKNPEEEAKRFIDGWYYSGDIGRFDDDGYLYVVGRMKDIIKTGSINVAPKEVEEILLLHPHVVDAAVVGEPHPEWGEAIKAYVVARDGQGVTAADLMRFCKEYLADYKVPKQIHLVKDLKRNELGKVSTKDLQAQGSERSC
jgi:acyl-CoA synthetase (AMP-forming)/AMP-acid ligase II